MEKAAAKVAAKKHKKTPPIKRGCFFMLLRLFCFRGLCPRSPTHSPFFRPKHVIYAQNPVLAYYSYASHCLLGIANALGTKKYPKIGKVIVSQEHKNRYRFLPLAPIIKDFGGTVERSGTWGYVRGANRGQSPLNKQPRNFFL